MTREGQSTLDIAKEIIDSEVSSWFVLVSRRVGSSVETSSCDSLVRVITRVVHSPRYRPSPLAGL